MQDDGGTANGGVDLDPAPNTITVNVTRSTTRRRAPTRPSRSHEDTAYTFTAADFGFTDPNDVPANALLAVKITTLPAAGTLTLNGVGGTRRPARSRPGTIAAGSGVHAGANANGTGYATFTFQVQDDGGTANGGVDLDRPPNTMTVNVTPVNDPTLVQPDKHVWVASNPAEAIAEYESGYPLAITVPTDADTANLTIKVTSGPRNGAGWILSGQPVRCRRREPIHQCLHPDQFSLPT